MFTDLLSPMELAFLILLGVPALLGLVNVLKDLGLPTRVAPVGSVALGVAMMIAYTVWGDNRIFLMIMIGILLGLGVSGYYDLSRLIGQKPIPPAEITLTDPLLEAAHVPEVIDNSGLTAETRAALDWNQQEGR